MDRYFSECFLFLLSCFLLVEVESFSSDSEYMYRFSVFINWDERQDFRNRDIRLPWQDMGEELYHGRRGFIGDYRDWGFFKRHFGKVRFKLYYMNGAHGRHDFFCSIFEKLQENTRYCYEHQRSQHNRYHRTVTHECFQLRVKVSLELCEITE